MSKQRLMSSWGIRNYEINMKTLLTGGKTTGRTRGANYTDAAGKHLST